MESRVVTELREYPRVLGGKKNSTREIIAKISPSQKFNASFIVLFRLANTYHKGVSAALNSERLLKISTVSNIVPFCANTLLCSTLWIIPTESTNETKFDPREIFNRVTTRIQAWNTRCRSRSFRLYNF